MIVLNLTCGNKHGFEGWFASNEEYLRQSSRQLVSCPYCADMAISKLPTAPHVRKAGPVATGFIAAVSEMARNCEDVGENFPEMARKIHYQEIPGRDIFGVASIEEVKALLDEGVSLIPLPGFLRKNMN
ncbi:MAG: DUF1178 family protein [Betaproteobacteria bacterium]|nr:DUF1178 family protein [Betaproteobacteria bacterium]